MRAWPLYVAGCVLLLTPDVVLAGTGSAGRKHDSATAASSAVWLQRVDRFVQQYRIHQPRAAEQEFRVHDRGAATAGVRQLVKDLQTDDLRRTEAGFVLYALDLDRALGRSVLVHACRPGRRPEPLEDVLLSICDAYWCRPDQQLLSAALNLMPYADGAAAESAHGFVQRAARERVGHLLSALAEKPSGVWESVSAALVCSVENHTTPKYPALERVARQSKDPLHPTAQRLLRGIESKKREAKAILAAERRREAQRFPLVPRGVTLPKTAVKVLQSRYPRWHILGTSGFDDAVIASVRARFGKNAGPQHCWGDFDGNGLRDVALLIKPNQGAAAKLIALRQVKASCWMLDTLTSFDFGSGFQGGYSRFTIYITPRAPGPVTYFGGEGESCRLDLHRDGIEWNFEGKASVLYYWTGTDYATVVTGD